MSELLNTAAKMAQAARQRAAEQRIEQEKYLARQAEGERLAAERINEFVDEMQRHRVPTIPLYGAEEVLTGASRGYGGYETKIVDYDYMGNGWLIRDFEEEHWERDVHGLIVLGSRAVHTCRGIEPAPSADMLEGVTGDIPVGDHVLTRRGGSPIPLNNNYYVEFGGFEGLQLLSRALLRHGVA